MTTSIRRRTLIKSGIALAAFVAAPRLIAAVKESQRMRAIPSSGEQLPVMGLGTYQTFDVGTGAAERKPVKEVLSEFVALGGTVIDSSPMYGRAETVIGDVAADVGVAKKLFYATKVWTTGREAGIRQMKQSTQRMRGKPLPAWASDFDCRSWAQYFLKYIIGDPAVTCVIPATANPKHLADNMQASLGGLPDTAQRHQMLDYLRR